MLYEPLTLRSGAVLPNRLALAPLTNGQSLPDGRLGDDELAWLGRCADGGFGLLETCAAYVALDGKAWDGELGIDREDDLPGLTRLASAIKKHGSVAGRGTSNPAASSCHVLALHTCSPVSRWVARTPP